MILLLIGLTRDVEESQTVFVENDGFSVLLRAMQGGDEKVQTKAAFMMKAMCMSKPQFKGNRDKSFSSHYLPFTPYPLTYYVIMYKMWVVIGQMNFFVC